MSYKANRAFPTKLYIDNLEYWIANFNGYDCADDEQLSIKQLSTMADMTEKTIRVRFPYTGVPNAKITKRAFLSRLESELVQMRKRAEGKREVICA